MENNVQVFSLDEAKKKLNENVVSILCVQGDESKVVTSLSEAERFYGEVIQLND